MRAEGTPSADLAASSFYSANGVSRLHSLSNSAFDTTFNERMGSRAMMPHQFGIPKMRTGVQIKMDPEIMRRASQLKDSNNSKLSKNSAEAASALKRLER